MKLRVLDPPTRTDTLGVGLKTGLGTGTDTVPKTRTGRYIITRTSIRRKKTDEYFI